MIFPTIGRVVLFHPNKFFTGTWSADQPLPALVCRVWGERMINIGGFDADGQPFRMTSVRLLQDDEAAAPEEAHCSWMPYQKGQAGKNDLLEAKLQEAKLMASAPLI